MRQFFLLFVILNFNIYGSQKEDFFLEKISSEEKKEIEILFNQLFKLEPFAYTIYFDKPMTFSEIIIESDSLENELNTIGINEYVNIAIHPYSPSKRLLQKAWKTLEKYQRFFNQGNYLFIKRKFNGSDLILLINKQAFRETLVKHIDIFKYFLGQEFFPELLLNQIEKTDRDIGELLKNNHALLGILLGFGEYNAQLFEQREQLYLKRDSLDYLRDYKKRIKIQEEINKLWEELQCRNDYCMYSLVARHQVAYVCDRDHPESIELEKKYEKQAREINRIINEDNWIENIMLMLRSCAKI